MGEKCAGKVSRTIGSKKRAGIWDGIWPEGVVTHSRVTGVGGENRPTWRAAQTSRKPAGRIRSSASGNPTDRKTKFPTDCPSDNYTFVRPSDHLTIVRSSDHPPVRQSNHRTTIRPSDRPTIRPSDRPTDQNPDRFPPPSTHSTTTTTTKLVSNTI